MLNGEKALRFSKIAVANWRNFVKAEVPLAGRVFVVGPNAAGKSNFLDIFRFLHDLVSVGGGFQEAVARRDGVSSLRALAARRESDIAVEVEISGDDASPPAWRYELRFSQDKQRVPIIKREAVFHFGEEMIVPRPDDQDRHDPERLRQTYLEQTNANHAFRAIAQFFSSVEYLHIVPQLVRDTERYVGRDRDPFGGDFLEQVVSTPEKTKRARLRRIGEALRVAVPQLSEIKAERKGGRPHLFGKYEHWRPSGAWQSEGQFSDGTLRLLGLLWAALDASGPLLLEEPELSLHPEVVRFLPQMFARVQTRSRRQIILSTHSPEMLTDEGLGLNEVLALIPTGEGTSIQTAGALYDVKLLLEHGSTMAEAVLPHTRPRDAAQLMLFGE